VERKAQRFVPAPYREFRPPNALTRWVECSWCIQPAVAVNGYPVRPDGCVDLFYSRASGVQVIGTMTAERRFDLVPGSPHMGLRFRPGMAGRLLGTAPAELTDLRVALDDLWSGDLWGGRRGDLRGGLLRNRARELSCRLAEARTAEEQLRLLAAALPSPPDKPDAVQRAIEAIAASHGTVDLEWVARQANLSPRQFRRRCLEASGLAPKHLCRVLRFRHAWSLAERAAGRDWSGIAAEAGYFDQAHLIRDFRELAGGPPMSVFSNTAAVLDR
jgi:AraC-like DNA-binding protein